MDNTDSVETAVATRPMSSIPVKMASSKRFVSPMPKLDESAGEIPSYLLILAGVAATVTLAFSILLYLKH